MFLAHSFRLRDPWKCERAAEGAVRWSRGFHRPTGLEDDDDLWLVISGLPAEAQVGLNGKPLASPEGARHGQFLVTGLVVADNRIDLVVPSSLQPPAPGLQPAPFPYDVRLGVIGHS